MEILETLLDIAKIVIPSLIVFYTAYKVLKTYLDNEQKKELLRLNNDNKQKSLTLRLQAYERMALFLERIMPNALMHRAKTPNMKSRDLHIALLNNIRTEYDHNVSQQIYIGIDTWEMIKNAKETTVNFINIASQKVDPNSDAIELQKAVLQELAQYKEHELPSQRALFALKQEVLKQY